MMNEKDIITARALLENKTEINYCLSLSRRLETIELSTESSTVKVRSSALIELLEKELNYTNRRLISLGVTEIK